MRRGLTDPHKGSPDERRRCCRTEGAKRLCPDGGELYRRMLGGVLSRCVGQDEAQKKLNEVHDKSYGSCRRSTFTADFKG